MSTRTLNLDDAVYRYLLDMSLREHPAQAALRAAVNADDPKTRRRKLFLIAEKAADLAVAGEAWAVAHVADRLDGKPAQALVGDSSFDPVQISQVHRVIVDPRNPDAKGI